MRNATETPEESAYTDILSDDGRVWFTLRGVQEDREAVWEAYWTFLEMDDIPTVV